ncbi:PQQ-binding-like beta-propeller repeat protein [Streptomyces sp. NPDC006463]|uniref:outer membrane protein assembly factor BamB family protein n=1 Tax=Streptomyces sp. NPDC006463 TaxID=3364746 RepID=UPI0036980FDF
MADQPEPHTALHDQPFPELLGHACQAVISADGQWIAVSSVMHRSSRVAVYRAADLSCAHLLTFTMEAESIAFHPTLPLLAVGLDNYDEYCREGGLTLLEADTGHRVDFTDPAWGIEPVRWLDDHTLQLTFFALADGVDGLMARASVVRENWRGLAPDALDLTALDRTAHDPEDPRAYDDIPPPQPLLRTLAERAGRSYDGRGGVRTVAGLRDGRVLATRRDVAVECWAADGSALWSVPAPSASGGTRIEVAADERTVRVAAAGPDARARTDFLLVDTADGTVLDQHSVPFSAAMSARTDGVWAIRDTYNRSIETEPPTPPNTRIFAADGKRIGSVHEPDRYDLVPLDARRCPELLYGRRGRDVVALAPDGAAETVLFTVDAPLGRVVYASDATGTALLHGQSELVRRAFPSGEVLWSRPLQSAVFDLDVHAGVLHALCADGSLVSVDAADGAVLHRRPLPPYQPVSLHAAPDGTILVGTTAGQILRYPAVHAPTGTAGRDAVGAASDFR